MGDFLKLPLCCSCFVRFESSVVSDKALDLHHSEHVLTWMRRVGQTVEVAWHSWESRTLVLQICLAMVLQDIAARGQLAAPSR